MTQGSGSVSLFALQLAKALGARVIATTSSEEKAERLRALGADAVIEYVTTPEWSDGVLALTKGRGADRIVEVGGTGTIAQSIKSVAYYGEIALVGILDPTDSAMSLIDFFQSQSTLRTIGVGSRSDLEDMNRALALHNVHPVIDRVFSFGEAPEAFSYFADGKYFGKVVISH